ncbi:MAG: transglycosylase domain-containing protein [bacterium JZ-2024 1]
MRQKRKIRFAPRPSVWGRVLKISFLIFVVVVFVLSLVSYYYMSTLPPLEEITLPPEMGSAIFYARDGRELGRLYRENRIPVSYDKIPRDVKLAIIAAEDIRFFSHFGIDLRGLARAMWVNLKTRKLSQGGSTITQQLAREVFLTKTKTVDRKIREFFYALALERNYTKEKILEAYLNRIYFGHGAYGIAAAAKVYFQKDLSDLQLHEAALLSALPRAPKIYDPFRNPDKVKARRNYILDQMKRAHFISEQEAEKAKKSPLGVRPGTSLFFGGTIAPYAISAILEDLNDRYTEDELLKNNYKIYTTIDLDLQRKANEVIQEGLKTASERKLRVSEGALLALDAKNGHILALVGGSDFQKTQFNRAIQAKRHGGSAFKPFVFLTAFMQGYHPDLLFVDEPTSFWVQGQEIYTPKNYDNTYRGEVTLREALRYSINIVAIKLNDLVGPENVIQTMKMLGIRSPIEPVLSLPLGTSDVSLLEMVRSFCTLANLGERVEPLLWLKIVSPEGLPVDQKYPSRVKVLDSETVLTLVRIMQEVIESGTGVNARISVPAAGKTGTTSDYRDAWFVGFTPRLCVGVWYGNDDDTPMKGVVGGGLPAITWRKFMEFAIQKYPSSDFGAPLPASLDSAYQQ